jgi:Spy/CpxP family protein refolding chaperone
MRQSRSVILSLLFLFTTPLRAQSRRPTPHEAIESNIAPIATALRELNVTDAERAHLNDIIERSEMWAADMVQAQHRRDDNTVRDRRRRIELLATVLRARIDSLRAENHAAERERALVAALERRTQARATLERVTERRMILDRGEEAVSTFVLPSPDTDAGVRSNASGGAR